MNSIKIPELSKKGCSVACLEGCRTSSPVMAQAFSCPVVHLVGPDSVWPVHVGLLWAYRQWHWQRFLSDGFGLLLPSFRTCFILVHLSQTLYDLNSRWRRYVAHKHAYTHTYLHTRTKCPAAITDSRVLPKTRYKRQLLIPVCALVYRLDATANLPGIPI